MRTQYHHDQVHEKATVFFIPIVNLRLLGEYIECQNCVNTYKMEILDYDPEQEQKEIEAIYLEGIKKVMTTMMLADGKIEENEKSMMKDIYEKMADSILSNYDIDKEIKSCTANPVALDDCLKDSAAPAASGIEPPTIEEEPIIPTRLSTKCMEPPYPPAQPFSLP